MSKFIGLFLGKLLSYFNSWTGNFVLSLVLFLVVFKIFMSILDYIKANNAAKVQVANPFLSKVKEKYLGKDNDIFQKASFEIIDATHVNKFTVPLITFFIEFPVIFGMFFVLYNPISVLFGVNTFDINGLWNVAKEIVPVGISKEMDIVNAIHVNPGAFKEFSVADIASINSGFFDINLFEPAKTNTVSVIFPVLIICLQLFYIVKIIVQILRKKTTLKKQSVPLALYVLAGLVMSTAAFGLPMIFYLYFIIFTTIGFVSDGLIKFIMKKKVPMAKENNKICQEILKKYNIEDYVTAFQTDLESHKEPGSQQHAELNQNSEKVEMEEKESEKKKMDTKEPEEETID